MHILTVMDYDDPHGIQMCKTWFYLTHRYNPGAHITVFHGEKADEIRGFGRHFPGVTFVRPDPTGVPTFRQMRGKTHPATDMTLPSLRHIENHPEFDKFMYLEADAWPLDSLAPVWAAGDDKPFVAVEGRRMPGNFAQFNTGVYVQSQKDFVTYSKLMEHYDRVGKIDLPMGEQGMINSYFRHIGYDAAHPAMGPEYNSWALSCKILRADDDEIEVWTGARKVKPRHIKTGWKWWDTKRRSRLIHAFLLKYWDLPDCQPLWNYCAGKTRALETEWHTISS